MYQLPRQRVSSRCAHRQHSLPLSLYANFAICTRQEIVVRMQPVEIDAATFNVLSDAVLAEFAGLPIGTATVINYSSWHWKRMSLLDFV